MDWNCYDYSCKNFTTVFILNKNYWHCYENKLAYENSFNEKSDEWIEIEGIGRFKGLEIVSEEHQDINEITINLKYDEWDKNVL